MSRSLDILVLMGGWSAEREVSLASGAACADALERLGHRVTRLDMGRDVAARLEAARPELVFNALHGVPGEDGAVQGLMDLLGVPYTHSGCAASAIAMDKPMAKAVVAAAGVRVPEGRVVSSTSLFEADPLPRPYVVKPAREGSSVGVAILTVEHNAGTPVARDAPGPWAHYPELLAEAFIPGRELTVAVLGDEPLAVTELVPTRGFYDYDAKYTAGLTHHICPAEVPAAIAALAMDWALLAHRALGCRGLTRSDFRWDDAQGAEGLHFLELNTQPGMTALSLAPEQAGARGMDFDSLVARIVALALESVPRHGAVPV
jgi:D-alanine-D-alanine ligase